MTIFIFTVNTILGKGLFDSFLFAVALAVGITPEVLPIIMTITLSNGALRMAKEKVIVKRLATVEDFGNIDVLCCDKTGTLTEGRVTLQQYYTVDGHPDDTLVLYSLLCSAVKGGKKKRIVENPIDKAIWQSKKAAELESLLQSYTIMDVNEFDYERRIMSVLVKGEKSFLIAKGAPESILGICQTATVNKKEVNLTEVSPPLHDTVTAYENEGYRIIAVAVKEMNAEETSRSDETGMNLLGFLLFLDPPKKDAKPSLRMLQNLGVTIKVISGDSPVITRKICEEVGLPIAEDTVVTGNTLESLN